MEEIVNNNPFNIKSFIEEKLDFVIEDLGILQYNIVGKFLWGSRLFGTNLSFGRNDYDYVIVLKSFEDGYSLESIGDVDLHILSEKEFISELKSYDIMCLECYFTKNPIKQLKGIDFILDKWEIRKSFSSTSNNSWVKAKKKIILENEDNVIGLKSLVQSFRLLDEAIELAKFGTITYDKEPIKIPEHLVLNPNWDELKLLFQDDYNKKSSELRILCPKLS